jgi:tetratricopeptide (TPR) repeat protein
MTVGGAASLAGIEPDRARALLAGLTRGHLLSEHRPGRYAFHDLLRAYATEQARDREDDGARRAAVVRLLDHWLHTACAAAALLDPFFAPEPAERPRPGVVLTAPATAEEALRWFTAEHDALLASVSLAARSGLAGHAWRLAWALSTFLLRRGCWEDQARACRIALRAARLAGDVAGEAHALLLLALGDARSGRRDAAPALRESLRLLEEAGSYPRSQVTGHSSLIWIAEQQERYGDMLDHAERALGLARAVGDQTLEIMSLNDAGYSHARLGNYGQAIAYCGQALAGSRAAGELNWESAAWDSLGYIHHKLGDHQRAVTCYERSLDLCRELADRYNEAGTLDRLGDVHAQRATRAPPAGRGPRRCACWTSSGTPTATGSGPRPAGPATGCPPSSSPRLYRPWPAARRRGRGRRPACPWASGCSPERPAAVAVSALAASPCGRECC